MEGATLDGNERGELLVPEANLDGEAIVDVAEASDNVGGDVEPLHGLEDDVVVGAAKSILQVDEELVKSATVVLGEFRYATEESCIVRASTDARAESALVDGEHRWGVGVDQNAVVAMNAAVQTRGVELVEGGKEGDGAPV